MAATEFAVSADLGSADTFSDALLINRRSQLGHGKLGDGNVTKVGLSLYGTFEATVSVQIKRPDQSSWRTIESLSAPTEKVYELSGRMEFRAGIATGDYTSGTAEVEIA